MADKLTQQTILVVSLSRIRQDGRVLRQIESLITCGSQVVAFGYDDGARESEDHFRIVGIADPAWNLRTRVRLAQDTLAARLRPGEAATLAWARRYPGVKALTAAVLDYLAECARGSCLPRQVIANDWTSLPAALAAHKRYRLPFHYDSHEFATEEHAHRPAWRALFPPMIARLEAMGVQVAASVSCPGEGIRQAMMLAYAPPKPILVVRNVPDGVPMCARPVSSPIEVLYHGLFKPDRGLIELMRGVSSWPSGFRLHLRGRAPSLAFGAKIAAAARASAGRIVITDMVAHDLVVSAANSSDIGIFLPDLASPQNRHAMPNKLFEYLHAGLMIIALADTEMGNLVTSHGAGIVVGGRAEDLGAVLARLTPARIADFKANAGRAAATLCWAREKHILIDALGLKAEVAAGLQTAGDAGRQSATDV